MARLTRRYHVPSAIRRTSLRVEPDAAWALIEAGAFVIDVRRHDDRSPTLPGAVRIPPDEIPARLPTLPKNSPIVLACT